MINTLLMNGMSNVAVSFSLNQFQEDFDRELQKWKRRASP
jgi:hypothetical protein